MCDQRLTSPQYKARLLTLWNDLNNCVHAWLQRQLDLTRKTSCLQQRGSGDYNIFREQDLDRLGDKVIDACELLERRGLVDYKQGMAEKSSTVSGES